MKLTKVAPGIFHIDIPGAGLRIQCGCPADSVKHLIKAGLIAAVEKNGFTCETGPNAILLSDISLQKGHFANLAEFPVLQMFYFQGMLIPGHPNNTGEKPILMGNARQLAAQMEYIFRGNYGLVTAEEITRAGLSAEAAGEIIRMKRRFAFDRIRKSEDLLTVIAADDTPREVKNGAFIRRLGVNLYEFSFANRTVAVDLNLGEDEEYGATYDLGFHRIDREDFSVIHTGEGDGWDVNRSCMAGIITHRGRIYLIDAGPNLLHSLGSLGIGVGEIEGIFHTHCHDDHFNGLTTLMRSDHRIKYFATPLVRHSVVKKLCGLMSFGEEYFERFFEVRDLDFDAWNDIGGLEVMPVLSPHPVDTSIFFFRAESGGVFRTYGHFADIVSLSVLREMVTADENRSGVSKEYYESVRTRYLTPADVKKIDIGGGMIHGNVADFTGDRSGRLILSHTAKPPSPSQLEIGIGVSFGETEVLIPARRDYLRQLARDILGAFFPAAPGRDLDAIAALPVAPFAPGGILVRNGERNDTVHLLLTGVAEYVAGDPAEANKITSGTFMGEISGLMKEPSPGAFRAYSHINALEIPTGLYLDFLKRNDMYVYAIENMDYRRFLAGTWLFGERVSCMKRSMIARSMKPVTIPPGRKFTLPDRPGICLIAEGEAGLFAGGTPVETVARGGIFGEESVLFGEKSRTALAKTDVMAFFIPGEAIRDLPIVQWKMLEVYERRSCVGC